MPGEHEALGYGEGIVAFVDLLGFRERVKQSKGNAALVREIWEILQSSRAYVEDVPGGGITGATAYQFSDTVVFYMPSSERESARAFFNWLTTFQMEAVNRGWLMRGGLAVGDVLVDGPVLFGPAMIRAHDLERMAVWPRQIVDPQMEAGDFADVVHNYCTVSVDGFPALDYLGTMAARGISATAGIETRAGKNLGGGESSCDLDSVMGITEFILHGEVISRALADDSIVAESRVWARYSWLATCHNATIRTLCGAADGDGQARDSFLARLEWLGGSELDGVDRSALVNVLQRMASAVEDLEI
ncbi:MAG: hypothetical protein E4G93_06350 [Dehalococcoidia bacterium]|nr:MAG: hypothetical protein E4G93_06350 [Dehalococcoidia bacterium]